MFQPPETQYGASHDGVHLAYQVTGSGELDAVFVPDWFNHVEAQWEDPVSEAFLRRLASFSRLVLFDKRGTGLSDPVALQHLPTIEEWMDDLRIVLDASGSTSVALVCASVGAFLGLPFAATYPERVAALVVIDGLACIPRSDDYPEGAGPDELTRAKSWFDEIWGTGRSLEIVAPTLANDHAFRAWRARYERVSASPGTVRKMFEWLSTLDVRQVLASITAPTLVMHRSGDRWIRPDNGRYLAEHIGGARYLELGGVNHLWLGAESARILQEIEEFLTGVRSPPEPDRVLTTVLFTDIVGSTQQAASLGDHEWRLLLDRHDSLLRRHISRSRGHEIKSTGDGVMANFDGPARAIQCAQAAIEATRALGIEVRAGLHTGECELRGEDLAGLAVHVAARIGAMADAGEVLVSSTVKDLVTGSGIEFDDRGEHVLKGVPGTWKLFAVRD